MVGRSRAPSIAARGCQASASGAPFGACLLDVEARPKLLETPAPTLHEETDHDQDKCDEDHDPKPNRHPQDYLSVAEPGILRRFIPKIGSRARGTRFVRVRGEGLVGGARVASRATRGARGVPARRLRSGLPLPRVSPATSAEELDAVVLCCPVASPVFGTGIGRAIEVGMPEIPGSPGVDELAAPGSVALTGCDDAGVLLRSR